MQEVIRIILSRIEFLSGELSKSKLTEIDAVKWRQIFENKHDRLKNELGEFKGGCKNCSKEGEKLLKVIAEKQDEIDSLRKKYNDFMGETK